MKKDLIVAGLDIGSTKVVTMIGIQKEEGLHVIGVGTSVNHGIRKGSVINIDATTEAIKKSRDEAELMAGVQIDKVFLGVSGAHIQSFDSNGFVAIRNKEVTAADVQRVIEAAQTFAVPLDRQVLHVIPREFKIDGQDGILDPIGMSGVRLEALVHIILGGQTAIQNLTRATEKAGLTVERCVLQQFASAKACLTEDEKNLGVALVDIGGGTTDLILFSQGSVAYTACLPLGGAHITNDVAVGLRTPPASAEMMKRKHGCALSYLVDESESIDVEGVGGRKERSVQRRFLCEVIEPRVEEILIMAQNEIEKSGLASLMGSGVVLTGGVAQMEGVQELGEFVFDMPVQKVGPKNFGGLVDAVKQPQFATAVGLLMFGFEEMKLNQQKANNAKKGIGDRWVQSLKDWVEQGLS